MSTTQIQTFYLLARTTSETIYVVWVFICSKSGEKKNSLVTIFPYNSLHVALLHERIINKGLHAVSQNLFSTFIKTTSQSLGSAFVIISCNGCLWGRFYFAINTSDVWFLSSPLWTILSWQISLEWSISHHTSLNDTVCSLKSELCRILVEFPFNISMVSNFALFSFPAFLISISYNNIMHLNSTVFYTENAALCSDSKESLSRDFANVL